MDNATAKGNRRARDAVLGITTIRPSLALSLAGAAICIAVVAGCAGGEAPSGQPSFYQNLAQPDMTVDPAAAASMISGYRSNNGLGAGQRRSRSDAHGRTSSRHAMAAARHDRITISASRSRSASAIRPLPTSSWWRTFPPATTRSPRRSPAGAIRRRIAPTCSIRGVIAARHRRRSIRRTRNTRCSGRSFSPATRGRASAVREGANGELRVAHDLSARPREGGDPGWIPAGAYPRLDRGRE